VSPQAAGTALVWSHSHHHIELPSAEAELTIEPGSIEGRAELRPGAVWTTSTQVTALVDASGVITDVRGPSLRWGPPAGLNMRWGAIFGLHAGMGRLDDTGTPLPSGGAYVGGMLGPRLGLVGCFSMVSGKGDGGGAIGFAWGVAAQWWPEARLWLRAGPAMVLAFDPGFDNAGLAPGATGGASYALVHAGSFVLDLRVDLTTSTRATFGSLGVGVNVN